MYSPTQATVKARKPFFLDNTIPFTDILHSKIPSFIPGHNLLLSTYRAFGIVQGQATPCTSDTNTTRKSQVATYPVIAIRMGDQSYHCINYTTYPQDPRFINVSTDRRLKPELEILGSIDSPTIFLTEGIWDLLTLYEMGYHVAALPGVNNFHEDWAERFDGKDVYILFDNDKPGKEYAAKHANKIIGFARQVKIINIPKEVEFRGEVLPLKDISDLYEIDHEFAQDTLTHLIEEAEEVSFNPQQVVSDIINGKLTPEQKYTSIAAFIQQDIEANGGRIVPHNNSQEFIIALNGTSILSDQYIQVHLCRVYGFLASSTLWRQVYDQIYQQALQTGDGKVYNYSHYDINTYTLYIGTANHGIIRITPESGIQVLPQGVDGVYIQSANDLDLSFIEGVLQRKRGLALGQLTALFLFDGHEDTYKFILKSWFLQTFFEPQMRVILCVIGEPGSGKTMLLKILKGILLGFHDGVYNPNNMPDEDHVFTSMVKSSRHLFFDEINESDPKMKTKFRMLVTGAEIVFREKYARQSVKIRSKVWLAVSAHSPKFRENDIAQRLCLIRLAHPKKSTKLINEFQFYNDLNKKREQIWVALLQDLYRVLCNLKANSEDRMALVNYCRQVEMADFSWQAFPNERDLCQKTFESINAQQEQFSAEFDPMLDLVDDWMAQFAKQNIVNGKVVIGSKELYRDMAHLAKEKGLKAFPITVQGFGKWIHGRCSVVAEQYGYQRERDTKSNRWVYSFNVPNLEKTDMKELF
jgi:energy-coupling factor transporter ATP-binding protein EcfA2